MEQNEKGEILLNIEEIAKNFPSLSGCAVQSEEGFTPIRGEQKVTKK